jgi:type VI secretion system secreted protein VgrG
MAISASISIEGGIGSLGAGDVLYRFMVFPFPPNHFMVHSLRGREELSGLYSFDVVVTASELTDGVLEQLALGQRALLVMRAGKAPRVFHGILASVRREGARESHGVSQYRMRLVPRAWLLKHRRRTRIFQNMRVDEIIAAVLKEVGIESRFILERAYPAREYCTQYEETDYRFVRRLCAEAGIVFRYDQPGALIEEAVAAATAAAGAAGAALGVAALGAAAASGLLTKIFSGEAMVFSDNAGGYVPIDDGSLIGEAAEALGVATSASVEIGGASLSVELASPTLYYLSVQGTRTAAHDKVTRFEATQRVRTNAATYREYDPERPMALITTQGQSGGKGAGSGGIAAASVSLGSGGLHVGASLDVGGALADALSGVLDAPELEYYEHHAPFLFSKWRYAEDEPALILRQKRRSALVAEGESTCPALAAGHRFQLEDHPTHELNRRYAVTAVEHEGWATTSQGEREVYRNRFSCVPAEVVFCLPRPKRKSVMVALTATVVGPPGAEIHTNPSGQIKVQFHWDRDGRNDDRSSCWIRTLQAWGGPGWGTQFIPRIGMEVIVTFEGGDPDKPLVLGCVYNGTHPPSFKLPEDDTRSGIRTQSSPGGDGFNELSFEDRAGDEQIYIHAQRNFDETIENDHTTDVRGSQSQRVDGDQTETIGKSQKVSVQRDRTVRVERDQTTEIRGSRSLEVTGDDGVTVTGDASMTVGRQYTVKSESHFSLVVGSDTGEAQSDQYTYGMATIGASERVVVRAVGSILLECGDTSIEISPEKLTLKAPAIEIKGSKTVTATGDGPSIRLDQQVELVGKAVKIYSESGALELDKNATMKAEKMLLNCDASEPSPPPPDDKKPEKQPFSVKLTDYFLRPIAGKKYHLMCEGLRYEGATDADGMVKQDIPKSARVVNINLWLDEYPTGRQRLYTLSFGEVPEADTPKGAHYRLKHMGYLVSEPGDELTAELRSAITEFQQDHAESHTLDPTGELDGPTVAALKAVYGS